MKVIKAGIAYQLTDGNITKIVFEHYDGRLKVHVDGVRREELIQVLIDSFTDLNQGEGYCMENVCTLIGLRGALNEQKALRERVEREKITKAEPSIDNKTLSQLTPEEMDHLSLGMERSFGLKLIRRSTQHFVASDGKDRMAFRLFCSVASVWASCEAFHNREAVS